MRVINVSDSNADILSAYDILIGSDLLKDSGSLIRANTNAKTAVIVTDDIVHELYCDVVRASLENDGFAVHVFVFPNGEPSKSHDTLMNLYAFLANAQVTRSDILIALGGGVVGDLTGYAAATYLRGLDFVQIPTTLLAQTDSSVGGKTGVNISTGKNLVGAFHKPILVICDINTLDTLPKEVYSDGMAEIIKHGMIYDKELFKQCTIHNAQFTIDEILRQSIQVKVNVVERDYKEKGERMKLNFGHTLGHAIEKHYNYTGITHGSAVSIGMAVFTKLSNPDIYDSLCDCLKKYNLPIETDISMDVLYNYCMNDKKRSGGDINIILCDKIGSSYIKKMTAAEFKEFLCR
ncbi:MAG: 3-dehydroquinate synthase [Oscillospiraceae bacterium]|nr:3-dehydroquinate synthase [Oscillospiraceae bacterium]